MKPNSSKTDNIIKLSIQYANGAPVLVEHLFMAILDVPSHALDFITDIVTLRKLIRVPNVDSIAGGTFSPPAKRAIDLAQHEANDFHSTLVEPEHLFLGLLREETTLSRLFRSTGFSYEAYKSALLSTLPETTAPEGSESLPESETPYLDEFGYDLTKHAEELDPCVGRASEIERVCQILSRRRKNNPVLLGEPGVGKTAIAEGLAQRIVKGDVPPLLKDKRVISLDLASMVAGTKFRGQFEERIKGVVSECEAHKEVVLYIDEIHTLIGAGASPGQMDAANLLKPALSRGNIQCIGATTLDEYHKSIEKDGALERRFQKVMVEPTTVEDTLTILHNLKDRYEQHHNVRYTDEALEACVSLTNRYIQDRNFPDKAIDAMDEAGSRIKLFSPNNTDEPVTITDDNIADTIAFITGIPVKKVSSTESQRLSALKNILSSKVIGQPDAVLKVVRAIQRNRIGLRDPNKPVASFLFVGPTGVGKTLLVKELANELYSKDALIRVDMSEYQQSHNVARLVGAPPGYVGYEEGGKLTEAVRRHPHSVVLFDEIEKAHPSVWNILLQVLDDGILTDGQGRKVSFKDSIIIMTSNVGSRQLKDFGTGIGFTTHELDNQKSKEVVMKEINKKFAPEIINRFQVVHFNPLTRTEVSQILDLELSKLKARCKGIKFTITDEVRELLLDKGFDKFLGARPIQRAITTYVEEPLCDYLLDNPDGEFVISKEEDHTVVLSEVPVLAE